jgi:hypothetical protein
VSALLNRIAYSEMARDIPRRSAGPARFVLAREKRFAQVTDQFALNETALRGSVRRTATDAGVAATERLTATERAARRIYLCAQ